MVKKNTTKDTDYKTGWKSKVKLSQLFPEGKGIWITGILGCFTGMAIFGSESGFILALPCMLIYKVATALLFGKTLWWTGYSHEMDGYHAQLCTRRGHPFKYWLTIVIDLLLAWWISTFIGH